MKHPIQLKRLFLIIILLFATISPYTVHAATFSDVTTSDARYAAINWAVENGYMSNTNGATFGVDEAVTEAQLVEVLAKVDRNYNYSKTVDMYYNHYGTIHLPLKGITDVASRSKAVTRVEFAQVYAATQRYDLSTYQAVQYLYVNEIALANNDKKTYAAFLPSNALTKGDLAVFLYRIVSKANNQFQVNGLASAPVGKDDYKITLPVGFINEEGTTVIPQPTPGETNDESNHPNTYNPVQSITVVNQELTANGVDSTLIKIKLKDGYGQTIPNDKSLQFKVTSGNGALFSTTGNGQSPTLTTVATDGGELSVYVTAPVLSRSVIDTIKFELVNNNEPNYEVFRENTIDVKLRYVPRAELRITYEVFDPTQSNAGGNIDSGIKPLPALPQGYKADGQLITMTDLDEEAKLFNGEKVETYALANGTVVTQPLAVTDIQYENANLQYAKQTISVWLFEQIYKNLYENMANYGVAYTIDEEGRATYNYPNYMEPNYLSQFETESHAVLIYLLSFIPAKKNDISMIHYDSVKAIKAIYDSFSVADQNKLRQQFKSEIAQLDAANAAVDSLKESQIIQDRPAGMERFTKVVASLVAPGGKIITDFKGAVEITFNGKRQTVGFTTNTTSYNPQTGHGGAAVAYFDDVIYGTSEVTAKIVTGDSRYNSLLGSLYNVPVTDEIFTNSKFEKNMCSRDVEVAYVMDQSMSMKKNDPTNLIAVKTQELITQMGSENSIAVRNSNEAYVQVKGRAAKVAATEGLFRYVPEDTKATNLSAGIRTALDNFTDNEEIEQIIVLISDGKTTQSQLQNALNLAKNNDVKIYTVTVGKEADVNTTQMKRIANETGGKYYHVTDVKNLHSTYQALIDTILCETVISDASCEDISKLFDEARITIGRSYVSMNGLILPNCTNVDHVAVQFVSAGGQMSIPLIARGENIFRTSTPIRQFSNFAFYTQVEFIAYDANDKIVGLKQVKIQ